jgi:hypothetical protein
VEWSSDNAAIATVSASGVVTARNEGTTVITVTTMEGQFTAICTITVLEPGLIVSTPTYPSDRKDVSIKTGIPENDLELNNNKLYINWNIAGKIAKELLRADAVNLNVLPIFSSAITVSGQTAIVSFSVKGIDLLATFPFEVNLIGLTSRNIGRLFKYVKNSSDYDEKKFTIQYNGAIYLGEINPDENYELLVFIKDGGEFDLDGLVNGEVLASIFLASGRTVSSSSGGCSAAIYGYFAFALLAIQIVIKNKIQTSHKK